MEEPARSEPRVTTIECPSEVADVVVFARGALVTRRVTLPAEPLPVGPVELRVGGVTALAEPGSARARVEGTRAVVALRASLVLPAARTPLGSLGERVRTLELERAALAAERASVDARRAAFAGATVDPRLSRKNARETDPSARVGDALAVGALLAAEVATLDAQRSAVELALVRNAHALEALRLALVQGSAEDVAGGSRARFEFLVRLAPGDADARFLELTYVVGAARWWPVYAARFTEGGTRVGWSIEALVAQDSGEDWGRVKLALSTADLVHDARLPELPSLRLGRAQPVARTGYRPPPAGLDAMFEGFDRSAVVRPAAIGKGARGGDDTTPPVGMMAYGRLETASEIEASDEDLGSDGRFRETEAEAGMHPPSPPMQIAAAMAPQGFAGMPSATPVSRSRAAAPNEMRKLAGPGSGGGGGSSSERRSFALASVAAIEPGDAWLDFDALVLASAGDAMQRGRLVREASPGDRGALVANARANVDSLSDPPFGRDPLAARGHFDHRYDADGAVDVPSDARPHRVSVTTRSTAATPRFRTVPRESAEVYREAEITNPFDAPLLAGPVDVFIDGALTTTSAISAVDTGGALWLGLGVEERLRVARNARVDESSAGLLGGSTVVDHAVTVDITSSLGRAASIELVDRLPTSDDDDARVELLLAKPAFEKYDQVDRGAPVRGGIRWRIDVPAGARTRVEFSYRVTLPSKNELVGGNRRE